MKKSRSVGKPDKSRLQGRTDRLAHSVDGKILSNADVTNVVERKSLELKKPVPWQRFCWLMSDNTIFQGAMDQTMATEADKDQDKPVLLNLLITHYPDETAEIADFLAKSDDEIIALAFSGVSGILAILVGLMLI